MKTRTTSVLGSAALLLAVVGLAVWALSQLTGAQAAAERLPTIVVGPGVTQAAESLGSPGAGGPSTSLAAPGTTAVPTTAAGGSGKGSVTSGTTARTSGAAPPASSSPMTGITTMPGMTTVPDAAAPVTTSSPNTTMRMVVPDPMRQQEHHQSGESTPTTTGAGAMPHSQMTGASGSMGH